MSIIYRPKGKAREYAPLAINLYLGCTHACRYCYAPKAIRKPYDVFCDHAAPRDILDRLESEAVAMGEVNDDREILISFIGDPYQPAEKELKLTQEAIRILKANKLRFTVLTKGGGLAMRDFPLLAGYEKFRFGSSFAAYTSARIALCEFGANSYYVRRMAIKKAAAMGIPTWVSLEPVIWPEETLALIEDLHPFVDEWRIGKINHDKALEARIDWPKFVADVSTLLDGIGANYQFKKSLLEV